MAELKHKLGVDVSELKKQLEEANKAFEEYAKNVQKSGQAVDATMKKSATVTKESIKQQKELVKELEAQVKEAQKAYDAMAGGKAKFGRGGAGETLGFMKRALAEEKAALADMEKAAKEKGTSIEEKITGSITKWVAGLATLGVAMKAVKGIIESTTEAKVKFEQVTHGASAAVKVFFGAIASGDWSNFGTRLREAVEGAADFVREMEHIQNLQNEQKVRSSKLDIEIAELRENTFNKEDENNEKRLAALDQIIEKTKQKYEEESKLAEKSYETQLENAAKASGLEKEKVEELVTQFHSLDDLIEQGTKYNEITKLMNKAGIDPGFAQRLRAERDALGAGAAEAGKYVKQISRVTMEQRGALASAKQTQQELESKAVIGSRRDEMQRAALITKMREQAEEEKKNKEEAAKLEARLKAEREKFDAAMEAGNIAEAKAIADRIALLEDELNKRNKLAEAIQNTATLELGVGGRGNIVPGSTKTSGLTIGSVIPEKVGEKMANQAGSLRAFNFESYNKAIQKQKEYNKAEEEALRRQAELRAELVDMALALTWQIAEQIGMSDDQARALGSAMDALQAGLSGDYLQAAFSMLSGLISLIPSEAERFAAQIEEINKNLEEQERLIQLSERRGGQEEALKGELKLLQEQLNLLVSRREELERKKGFLGMFTGKKELAEVNAQIEEVRKQIEDAQTAMNDFLAGGVTENTLADTIAQAFQEGKTSVDDFADYMNNVLTDAVLEVFKKEILGKSLTDVTTNISKALEDKILTESEKNDINAQISAVADANKKLWDDLTGSLELGDIGNPQSLRGGIERTITEETGTELAGLMRKISDDNRMNRDYNKASVDRLIAIEGNTAKTVDELKIAVTHLAQISNNTKPVFTSDL